jgi:hypothetical protein
MYLMFGDEADAEQGRGQKFFVCGAKGRRRAACVAPPIQ